jgi:hypothetical protein
MRSLGKAPKVLSPDTPYLSKLKGWKSQDKSNVVTKSLRLRLVTLQVERRNGRNRSCGFQVCYVTYEALIRAGYLRWSVYTNDVVCLRQLSKLLMYGSA